METGAWPFTAGCRVWLFHRDGNTIDADKISLLPQTPYSVQQHDFQPETLPLRSELQYILQKRIVPHLYPGVVGAESFRVKPSLVARVQKAELRQAGK